MSIYNSDYVACLVSLYHFNTKWYDIKTMHLILTYSLVTQVTRERMMTSTCEVTRERNNKYLSKTS